jgi:hypothetical protein
MYDSRVLLYRRRDGNVRGLLAGAALALAALVSMPAAAMNTLLHRPKTLSLAHVWSVFRGIAASVVTRPPADVGYRRGRRLTGVAAEGR